VFSIIALLITAAREARAEILGNITPLGIVLLNVAANFAPWPGPLPLSLGWAAQMVPIPPGPLRTLLNLLLLYAPALLALLLQHRGPPGSAGLRFVLGAWVCWVGIAALVGPGWAVARDFSAGNPLQWMAAGFSAFAAMHLAMLALNLLGTIAEDGSDAARSIARSVRVDGLPLKWVVGIGAAFWVAAYAFRRFTVEIEFDITSAALIAAAFALSSLVSRMARDSAAELPRAGASLAAAGPVTLFAVVFGALAVLVWRETPSARVASQVAVSAATGQAYVPTPQPGLTLHYPEADLHAELKRELERHGVPFTAQRIGGQEYLRVDEAHRGAAQKAIEVIEGPPMGKHSVQFRHSFKEEAFTAWLDAHGVAWRKVRRRHEHYLTWDDGPHHDWLSRAFDDEQQHKYAGIDYHALYVALQSPQPLMLDGVAAFRTPDQHDRFLAWLREQGIKPREVTRGDIRFVEWEPSRAKLLEDYIRHAHTQCWQAAREKSGQPPPAGAC
jgi:hypothetical protein